MSRYSSNHKPSQDINDVRFMNERDWRVHLSAKLDKVDEKINVMNLEMATLKIKVAGIASIISSLATFLFTKLGEKL